MKLLFSLDLSVTTSGTEHATFEPLVPAFVYRRPPNWAHGTHSTQKSYKGQQHMRFKLGCRLPPADPPNRYPHQLNPRTNSHNIMKPCETLRKNHATALRKLVQANRKLFLAHRLRELCSATIKTSKRRQAKAFKTQPKCHLLFDYSEHAILHFSENRRFHAATFRLVHLAFRACVAAQTPVRRRRNRVRRAMRYPLSSVPFL